MYIVKYFVYGLNKKWIHKYKEKGKKQNKLKWVLQLSYINTEI